MDVQGAYPEASCAQAWMPSVKGGIIQARESSCSSFLLSCSLTKSVMDRRALKSRAQDNFAQSRETARCLQTAEHTAIHSTLASTAVYSLAEEAESARCSVFYPRSVWSRVTL